VKLVGFGIAHLAGSDQFALGTVLLEMLAGVKVFRGEGVLGMAVLLVVFTAALVRRAMVHGLDAEFFETLLIAVIPAAFAGWWLRRLWRGGR
jgi:hypothetical protein